MGTKEGYFTRLKRRLTEDLESQDKVEIRRSAEELGGTHMSQCCRGDDATIVGRLRTVGSCAKDGNPVLEAEIFDGTDSVMLVWFGRLRIPGIEPGRTVKVRGRVGDRSGSKVIYNPRYELQST